MNFMAISQLHRIPSESAGQALMPTLVQLALEDPENFLQTAILQIKSLYQSLELLAIVQGVKGTWRILKSTGEFQTPTELLTETLDSEIGRSESGWIATPLSIPCKDGRLWSPKPTHLSKKHSTPSQPAWSPSI